MMDLTEFLDELDDDDGNDREIAALRFALREAYEMLDEESTHKLDARFPDILEEAKHET